VSGTATGLKLQQQTTGELAPTWTVYRVVLHGLPTTDALTITVDGKPVEVEVAAATYGAAELPQLLVPAGFGELEVKLA
jgi:hypothetical protein